MPDESTRLAESKERACPKCGSDELAWVSSESDNHIFECRKCRTLFAYHGPL